MPESAIAEPSREIVPVPPPQTGASNWAPGAVPDGHDDGGEDDSLPGTTALDRLVTGTLGRWTQGISPSSIVGAYADWTVHLALSPGKRLDLVARAWRKFLRLGVYAGQAGGMQAGAPAIVPLAQDTRFQAAQWQQWPFNLIYQSFLLGQQWWHNATTGVHGVSRHHEQMVTFLTRQWLDIFSPSNVPWLNPEVMEATMRERGANLLRGAGYGWRDWVAAFGVVSREPSHFQPGVDVALTPGKVVYRNHLMELIQYEAKTPQVHESPVLIVPSWIMKYYILDLSPGNSLVRYLVEHGYTVFMVSWRNPGSADREIGMDDYLKSGPLAAVQAIGRIRPQVPILGVGYCLGGTLLAMAAAWLAREGEEQLRSLTLLAAEVDFTEPGELGLFVDESQLAFLEDVMWEQGYLDGRQMAGAFTMLNSRDLVWSRIVRDYLLGNRRAQTDLTAWNADATRMPYRQHREYLERLYLNNELAEGRYLVDERPIALSDLHMPMFVLGTERDTVSPWRSVYKMHLFADADITFCLSNGGHNAGVVNPPDESAHRSYRLTTHAASARYVDPETWYESTPVQAGSWWPAWENWLRARAGDLIDAPPMGSAAAGLPSLEDAPGRYVRMH